mmetsp:Transcript_35708/g.86408  ORF Transcript_35708/g.86408 Transcript_35708/m.86408 type:complete len:213 (-) Transcript_35708:3948-4586(-)
MGWWSSNRSKPIIELWLGFLGGVWWRGQDNLELFKFAHQLLGVDLLLLFFFFFSGIIQIHFRSRSSQFLFQSLGGFFFVLLKGFSLGGQLTTLDFNLGKWLFGLLLLHSDWRWLGGRRPLLVPALLLLLALLLSLLGKLLLFLLFPKVHDSWRRLLLLGCYDKGRSLFGWRRNQARRGSNGVLFFGSDHIHFFRGGGGGSLIGSSLRRKGYI